MVCNANGELVYIFFIENNLQSCLSLVLTWIRMLDLLLQIWFLFASGMKNISSSSDTTTSGLASNCVGFVFQVYYGTQFPQFRVTKRKFELGTTCIASRYLTTRLQGLKDLADSKYLNSPLCEGSSWSELRYFNNLEPSF